MNIPQTKFLFASVIVAFLLSIPGSTYSKEKTNWKQAWAKDISKEAYETKIDLIRYRNCLSQLKLKSLGSDQDLIRRVLKTCAERVTHGKTAMSGKASPDDRARLAVLNKEIKGFKRAISKKHGHSADMCNFERVFDLLGRTPSELQSTCPDIAWAVKETPNLPVRLFSEGEILYQADLKDGFVSTISITSPVKTTKEARLMRRALYDELGQTAARVDGDVWTRMWFDHPAGIRVDFRYKKIQGVMAVKIVAQTIKRGSGTVEEFLQRAKKKK